MNMQQESLLNSYQNGNVFVQIFSNGTKIREYEGEPKPVWPESMDVKITNYCNPTEDNPICSFCHEMSGLNGKHADLNKLLEIAKDFPSGTEWAIGGGRVFSHPDIISFLQTLKSRGIIANITENEKHLNQDYDLIKYLFEEDLIKGFGISYKSEKYLPDIERILQLSDNVVFHLIAGINTPNDIEKLNELCLKNNKQCKILLLGYKTYGFGEKYIKNNPVEENKYQWFIKIGSFLRKKNLVMSFDNLAIEQMKLKRFFTDEAWNTFFMGSDGSFTMYVDAVKQQFAKSSTSNNRMSFDQISLKDYFKQLR